MLSHAKTRAKCPSCINALVRSSLTTRQPKFAIGELVPLSDEYDTEIDGDLLHHTGLIRGVCFEADYLINGNEWIYTVYPSIDHPLHDDVMSISEFDLICLIKERSNYLRLKQGRENGNN